jgi:hypothetical protein
VPTAPTPPDDARREWWSDAYRLFLRRVLVRVRGDRCQRCRTPAPRPLCLRVPPPVEVRHPRPGDAELLCVGCCRARDRETLNGPAVRARKRRDRADGLYHREQLMRWADDGGRVDP